MILVDLFSEMPYAAALNADCLRDYCSTCFAAEATIRCENECKTVVYCDEKCRDQDRSNHEIECEALKKMEPGKNVNEFVRLLGRILTRRSIDQGIAHLCDDFPKNIPDRRLSDLMSHQSEIEKSKNRSQSMKETLAEFAAVFEGTALVENVESVKQMYCVMWINCFAVSGALSMKTGHEKSVGLGFYLNTSRFDHSCRPELHIHFDGARLRVQYPSTAVSESEYAEDRWLLTRSTEVFNKLTISYGYSGYFTNNSYFPLRWQRRASLQNTYYFECRCHLCQDKREACFEENAANFECHRCGLPYYWQRIPFTDSFRPTVAYIYTPGVVPAERKLLFYKSCDCTPGEPELEKSKDYMHQMSKESLPLLEVEWLEAMSVRVQDSYADEIIKACEPVHARAKRYWHPSYNLCFSQLSERLFVSYSVLLNSDYAEKGSVDRDMLKKGLESGRSTIEWYKRRTVNTYCTAIAAYAKTLAELHRIGAATAKLKSRAACEWKEASCWFKYAASIWRIHGKPAAEFVRKLEFEIDEAEKMVDALYPEIEAENGK